MKLGTWITDNFSGIKEGVAKRSFVCLVARERDKKTGHRGLPPNPPLFPIDKRSHGRGPRPNTWAKLQRAKT